MPKIYYQEDCNLSLLEGKAVAVIGCGSQGHAYALGLKKSGCNAAIGLYGGNCPWKRTEEQGFEVYIAAEASKRTGVIMILVNDEKQAAICKESIASNLRPSVVLMFARSFAIHSGQIIPSKNMDVTMTAPEAPGHTVRGEYQRGRGTPCLATVYQNVIGKTMGITLAYGQGIGGARASILETALRVGAETSLFGKQAVFCDGVRALMKTGFETLIEAGYAPENVYFECVHEIKLIVDLIYEGDFTGMCYSISNTAEYGDCITELEVVTGETKKAMKKIPFDIRDGPFVEEWPLENQVDCPYFNAVKKNEAGQLLEKVGTGPRKLYSWDDMDKLINN